MRQTILVVDDDPAILDVSTLILEDAGFAVRTCVDGRDLPAVLAAADRPPDLILLDVRMSGVDGRRLCRRLKERDPTRRIPVLMVSADRGVDRLAAECGADGAIAKPFDMADFVAAVEAHLAPVGALVGRDA